MNIEEVIASLPVDQQEKLFQEVEAYKLAVEREKCQTSFLSFVKKMWPGFIHGRHHAVVAKAFEDVAAGKIKRLAISMPPRHTKSEFGSFLFPAWFLGKFPDKKVMQSSNTSELAVGFGRKVRNLVDSEMYHEVFPNVKLRQDSKSAGRWAVNDYGEYFAIGVGGTMTGRGADIVIIDDPHSEQEATLAAHDPSVYDSTYEWYTSGPRQRLQPNGSIIIIATRWSERDLIGRVLQDAAERGKPDEWRVIEFPAILPSGNPLWPEFWSLELLEEKFGGSEYTTEQIKVYLVTGQMMLLVATDDHAEIHGAATVSFINYPNDRVAFVTAIGGKLVTSPETFAQMSDVFKANGATKIQGMAKEAVARLWKRFGFEEKAILVEVKL